MDAAPTLKRAWIMIASMGSPGSTKKLRDAGALTFSALVIAQKVAPSATDVQSLSFLLAPLRAFAGFSPDRFAGDWHKMIDRLGILFPLE